MRNGQWTSAPDVRPRASRSYAGRVTDPPQDDAPDDDATEAETFDASADASTDGTGPHGEDVVDTNVDRFIDRMVQSSGGSVAGNAMIGMAKGMGLYKKVEVAGEIREVGPPDDDPDDPIEVTIDADHPENTRIVYRMPSSEG